MDGHSHIIKQQTFDIAHDDQTHAQNLQRRFSRLQQRTIELLINRLLNEFVPEERWYQIDRMELDLGTIAYKDLELEVPHKIEEKLSEALRRMIFLTGHTAERNAAASSVPLTYRLIQLLKHFLRTGSIPWWQAKPEHKDPDAIVQELIKQEPRQLIDLIRSEGKRKLVFQRLMRQLKLETLIELLQAFEPIHASKLQKITSIESIPDSISGASIPAIRQHIIRISLHYFVHKTSKYFKLEDLLDHIARSMTNAYPEAPVEPLRQHYLRVLERMDALDKLVYFLTTGLMPVHAKEAKQPDTLLRRALSKQKENIIERLQTTGKDRVVFDRLRFQLDKNLLGRILNIAYNQDWQRIVSFVKWMEKQFSSHSQPLLTKKGNLSILIELALEQLVIKKVRVLDVESLVREWTTRILNGVTDRTGVLSQIIESLEVDSQDKDLVQAILELRSERLEAEAGFADEKKIVRSWHTDDPELAAQVDQPTAYDKLGRLMHFLKMGYLPVEHTARMEWQTLPDLEADLLFLIRSEPIRLYKTLEVELHYRVVRERLVAQFDFKVRKELFELLSRQMEQVGLTYLWYRHALLFWQVLFADTMLIKQFQNYSSLFFLENLTRDEPSDTRDGFLTGLFDFLAKETSIRSILFNYENIDALEQKAPREWYPVFSLLQSWLNRFQDGSASTDTRTLAETLVGGGKAKETIPDPEDAEAKKTEEDKFHRETPVLVLQHFLSFGFVPKGFETGTLKDADDLLLTALSTDPAWTLSMLRAFEDTAAVIDRMRTEFTPRSKEVLVEYICFEFTDDMELLFDVFHQAVPGTGAEKDNRSGMRDRFNAAMLRHYILYGAPHRSLALFISDLFMQMTTTGRIDQDDLADMEALKRSIQQVFEKEGTGFSAPFSAAVEAFISGQVENIKFDADPVETGQDSFLKDVDKSFQEMQTDGPLSELDGRVEEQTSDQEQLFEETKKIESLPEFLLDEDIYISNAGLVLIAPYLPAYFDKLGLLNQGKFKSESDATKAVHLLQHMATGEERFREPELVLNKVLCGIPLIHPIETEVEITSFERDESIELLTAVIKNWEALKAIPIDHFRHNFLKRDGRLDVKHERIDLKVEEKAYDVLMRHLPWSISIIKSTWMEKPLYVEWNY